jgi:D-galactarolactone isomerase
MTRTTPGRRSILRGSLAAAAVGAMLPAAPPADAQQGQQVRWSTGTELPKLHAPANATDCHFHIYDSSFPIV